MPYSISQKKIIKGKLYTRRKKTVFLFFLFVYNWIIEYFSLSLLQIRELGMKEFSEDFL